jgi:putative FmdB family regulatory protein
MPIYEYRCRNCGEITEVMQKIGDGPLRKCRSCSGRLEKLVSRTSFLLKGGGWYAEGYHKGSSTQPAAKSKDTKKDSPSGKSSAAKKKASSSRG